MDEEKTDSSGDETNPWPFQPPVFDWNDPRDPSLENGTPPKFKVDRKTGAILDTSQPGFYFEPTECSISITLSNITVIYDLGSPWIKGVGEIDFEGQNDLIGIIGKDAVSDQITVEIYPASALGESKRTALLSYIGALEPDPWQPGIKEEWFVWSYIEDSALRNTVEVIERKPPKKIQVYLRLNKGIYRRHRFKNSFAGGYEDTHQITMNLCPGLHGYSISPEDAEGDTANVRIFSETWGLKNDEDDQKIAPNQKEQIAEAIERIRITIERFGVYLSIAISVLVFVLWFR